MGPSKTTSSLTMLPEMLNCVEFLNADYINLWFISLFSLKSVAIGAGKIMLKSIEELINQLRIFEVYLLLS